MTSSTRAASPRRDHRPRVGRERRARTETRILQAALGVFAAMGPDAPTIDDITRAAAVSRGTFYNHFDSVEALLAATSKWTTRDVIESIERAIDDLRYPPLRLGVGLRLFFARAQSDHVWCRFVARVWKLGGIRLPVGDIKAGIQARVFRASNAAAARDLLLGATRQALAHIGSGKASRYYGTHMAEMILQALGTERSDIAAALRHPLPSLQRKEASR